MKIKQIKGEKKNQKTDQTKKTGKNNNLKNQIVKKN
jgi:hypothetical protein